MSCTPFKYDPSPDNTTSMSEWVKCVNRSRAELNERLDRLEGSQREAVSALRRATERRTGTD